MSGSFNYLIASGLCKSISCRRNCTTGPIKSFVLIFILHLWTFEIIRAFCTNVNTCLKLVMYCSRSSEKLTTLIGILIPSVRYLVQISQPSLVKLYLEYTCVQTEFVSIHVEDYEMESSFLHFTDYHPLPISATNIESGEDNRFSLHVFLFINFINEVRIWLRYSIFHFL